MSVSVIVPTRDRPELLARAVASIPRDHEVLVVDDGSVDPVSLNDTRVRVLRRETSGGAAAARNAGIEAATGDWLGFCDDDDEWLPGRVVPAGSQLVVYGSSDTPAHRRFNGETVLDGYTPSSNAVLVRRDLCPRFDEDFRAVEDVEWWLRLAQVAPVTFVDVPGYRVGVHAGTRHGAGQDARIGASYQLLAKHAGWFVGHPAAQSFRLARIGQMTAAVHGRRAAAGSLVRALRAHPTAATVKSVAAALKG